MKKLTYVGAAKSIAIADIAAANIQLAAIGAMAIAIIVKLFV